jgi:lysophospholipase L1-like esterase
MSGTIARFRLRRLIIGLIAGAPAIFLTAAAAAPPADTTGGKGVKIVVLGSSTPAGKNIYKLFDQPKAAEQEYAEKYNWVALYRQKLKDDNPANKVINLSTAGGFSIAAALNDRKGSPTYRNSLAFVLEKHANADAIILNFAGVREAQGEDVESAIRDFKEIERLALEAGIGYVWVGTAQPYTDPKNCYSKKTSCEQSFRSRVELSQAILDNFPVRTIDFYRALSVDRAPDSLADKALLNPKDRLHPNLEGHEAMRDAVIAARVYETAKGE